jgi:hypothetical protein
MKAFAVVHLGQPQPVLVVLREGNVATVEVVEYAEFHRSLAVFKRKGRLCAA